jgi:hypothetical protein
MIMFRRIQKAEVSDTTGDATCTAGKYKIKSFALREAPSSELKTGITSSHICSCIYDTIVFVCCLN